MVEQVATTVQTIATPTSLQVSTPVGQTAVASQNDRLIC